VLPPLGGPTSASVILSKKDNPIFKNSSSSELLFLFCNKAKQPVHLIACLFTKARLLGKWQTNGKNPEMKKWHVKLMGGFFWQTAAFGMPHPHRTVC
jgi:hypothetical protein